MSGSLAVVRQPRRTPPAARATRRTRGFWISRQTRSGVHGRSMCLTPRCLSASTTAFCTAGRRADGRGLADALGAHRVHRRRGLGVGGLEHDRVGRGRDGVVGEGAGDRRALLVVHHLLPQRLADALDRAAVLLAGHDQRVQDPAAVVDRDVAQRLRLAGLDVDLDDRDVGAERERRALLGEVGVDAEAAVVLVGVGGELAASDDAGCRAPRRRRSRSSSSVDVVGVGLEHPGRDRDRLLAQSRRRPCETALPPSWSDREPPVPPPVRTTAVSDWR